MREISLAAPRHTWPRKRGIAHKVRSYDFTPEPASESLHPRCMQPRSLRTQLGMSEELDQTISMDGANAVDRLPVT